VIQGSHEGNLKPPLVVGSNSVRELNARTRQAATGGAAAFSAFQDFKELNQKYTAGLARVIEPDHKLQ